MSARPLALALLAACAAPPVEDEPLPPRTFPEVIGGARPAPVLHPVDVDEAETLPAVVLLHGYAVTALLQDLIFQLQARVETERFLLVMPEGTPDEGGAQFWDAAEECCGFDSPDVDDVAYLSGLVDELRATWRVGDVAFVGHSNGGYMSYRLACDTPASMDRMVVLAGGDRVQAPTCVSGPAVGLLHVHGTDDTTVAYGPTDDTPATPGAAAAVARVADRNGCDTDTVDLGTADLLSRIEGEESTGVQYTGCAAPVALWTTEGGDHLFAAATEEFRDGVVAFALRGEVDFR